MIETPNEPTSPCFGSVMQLLCILTNYKLTIMGSQLIHKRVQWQSEPKLFMRAQLICSSCHSQPINSLRTITT